MTTTTTTTTTTSETASPYGVRWNATLECWTITGWGEHLECLDDDATEHDARLYADTLNLEYQQEREEEEEEESRQALVNAITEKLDGLDTATLVKIARMIK